MKPREGASDRIVGEWLLKAENDIAVAERLLSDDAPFTNAIAFHCQQAAEKYLKALLTHWRMEFPKTHVLATLLKLIESRDAELTSSLFDVVILTPYGVALRYPGNRPDVSLEEAREAVRLARKARETIMPLLPNAAGQ